MTQQHGADARDRLWSHPDLLPTSDDLDEPLDFVARHGMDDELAALTADDAEQPETPEDDDGEQPGRGA
jgi:hypothetical protein